MSRKAMARGFCRVPHKFFLQLPRQLSYCEYVCLGLILDATVGWQRDRAAITIQQFCEVVNVTRRAVEMALNRLQQLGHVAWTIDLGSGDRYYSLAPELVPDQAAGELATGKCSHCGAVGDVEVEPAGIAQVPHSFFRRLPQALSYSEFVVVGFVLDQTLGWQREQAQISLGEFSAASGFSRRQIEDALDSCEGKGLINRDHSDGQARAKAGRAVWYRVHIEAFGTLDARVGRTIEREERRGETAAKEDAPESTQPLDSSRGTRAVECLGRKVLARCRECGIVGLVTLREPQFAPLPRPNGPNAAGGGRQPAARAPAAGLSPRRAGAEPPVRVVPGLKEYLLRWSGAFCVEPDDVIVDRISAALGEATLSDFAERCTVRSEYIERHAKGFAFFVQLAADVARATAQWRRAAAAEQEARVSKPGAYDAPEIDVAEARRLLARADLDEWERRFLLERFPDLAAVAK